MTRDFPPPPGPAADASPPVDPASELRSETPAGPPPGAPVDPPHTTPPDDHLEPRPLPTTRVNRAVFAVVGIAAILVLWAGVWAFGRAAERNRRLGEARPDSNPAVLVGGERQLDRLQRQAARPDPSKAPDRRASERRLPLFQPRPVEPLAPSTPTRSTAPEKSRRELLTEAAWDAPRLVADFGKPGLYDHRTVSASSYPSSVAPATRSGRPMTVSASYSQSVPSSSPSGSSSPADPATGPNLLPDPDTFLDRIAATGVPPSRAPSLTEPLSPFTLHQGWLLPAVLTTGINSDLPGQVTAVLRAPVYDSATGRHELLPAGSRLVGTYDHRVAWGQRRILIAWRRLVFPDGRALDLGALPGTDLPGLSGLRDRVDNHFLRTFGSALLVSALSAGVQLSQPQESQSFGEAASTRQVLAAALGQEIDRTANQILRRNLTVEPTLKIRPGYLFYVQLTADLVLPGPWRHPRSPAR